MSIYKVGALSEATNHAGSGMIRRSNKKGVNWNVKRRYEFIEFRLHWQGNINRSDLMEVFGISVQQASKDLTNYIKDRKSNLAFDKRLRTYLRGKNFRPRYIQPDAAEYFAQLQAVEMDYRMVDGKAEIVVRKALLFYALKRLGLDTDPEVGRPRDQRMVLSNHAAIKGTKERL